VRKVAIFGGGQSGLLLALGLLQNQYEVTVVSNRTPEQILSGRVSSSQFMFHDALQNEKDLGINFWESECPITEGNDPITGQGANTASKAASIYLQRILERTVALGDQP
jgi:predicted dinucleotide-binding enzyme